MSRVRPEPVPPHPLLPGLYRTAEEKREWLRRIFTETAGEYDRAESWLSLGSGRWYRRQALKRAGLSEGMSVADVACGTGLVAAEAKAIVGDSGRILGVDPSEGMLREARKRLSIQTVVGTAESIPSEAESFDFVSMGYALRHVEDLGAAFAEFHRVLKPGGRVCVLEISRPSGRMRRAVLKAYMMLLARLVLPLIAKRQSRTPELWRYYWKTIDSCVSPRQVGEVLRRAGFDEVRHSLQFGVFSEYTARRPGHA